MMRSSKLFPLLTGLLLLGAPACGDDGDSSDDVSTDDSPDASTDDTDDGPTDTDDGPTDTDDGPTDTDDGPTDTDDGPTDTDDTPTDVDGGADTDDGGTSTDDGGVTTDDGGTVTDDGGTTTDDGGMPDGGADEDAAPPLPEGACAESPEDPANGAYADCAPTLDGESCELVCDTNFVKDGNATCIAGEWTTQTCVALGSLSAVVGNAETGAAVDTAEVYVKGFYDPETEECSVSDYCQLTSATGQVTFEFFPSGDQEVVIVKEGFDEIALPINIEPGSSQTVRLDALPTGFLSGNIVILLGWQNTGNLDVLLNVPGEDGQCVNRNNEGTLDPEPYAQLDIDASGSNARNRGPETLRIKLNDAGTGPYYDGTYSVVVVTPDLDVRTLQGTVPSVRLIREGANGGADVQLFDLPESAVENAHAWHVFDLHGDGTLTVTGDTETLTDHADSEFACVAESYTIP